MKYLHKFAGFLIFFPLSHFLSFYDIEYRLSIGSMLHSFSWVLLAKWVWTTSISYFIYLNRELEWNFLSFRLWIAIWATIILLILIAFNTSALARYITRFTEEAFTGLIASIFIFESISNTIFPGHSTDPNGHKSPPVADASNRSNQTPPLLAVYRSFCAAYNKTGDESLNEFYQLSIANQSAFPIFTAQFNAATYCNGPLAEPSGNAHGKNREALLFGIVLFIGTFVVASQVRSFRDSSFLSSRVEAV